ncbi:MAG: tetratricopeptide repeat protein [Candidatus Aminicenantes bacterium]|nr:MAG: tetratricopeptide repeat protein [Candidatus Aminicenantes bacterium]
MVKKTSYILLLIFTPLFWSCATYQPPPPTLYIEDLPQGTVAELSLEERIITEDAWTNLKQGKGDKARKIISKLEPKSSFYYVGLGYAYLLQKEFQISEDNFKNALKYYPEMNLIHIGLAQVYQDTGRESLAFAEYREILKREPGHSWAAHEYEILKNKKTEEALNQAKAAHSEGDTERSKEAYNKTLYYSPKNTESHLALAEIYIKENKLQNALTHLRTASSNEPDNKEILKKYGEVLFQAEQHARSLEIFERLLSLEPQDEDIKEKIENLKNRLGIFELPSQYNTIVSREAVSREEIAALLSVEFKEILGEPSPKPPIIVDIATSWASNFILKITSFDIMEVYPNHTFLPRKIVTRAEMAKILLRLINYLREKGYRFIQQIPPEKIQISDVSPDNYYYQLIIQIISYNIMDLSPERSFNPDLPVSGTESIKLLNIILTLIK